VSRRLNEFIKTLGLVQEVEDRLTSVDRLHLRAYAARPDDGRLRQAVEGRLMLHAASKTFEKRIFSVPRKMKGDFLLGYHRGGEARAELGGPQAHILQVGGSGSGKTCNTFFWLLQLAPGAEGVMAIDLYKREYRDLLPAMRKIGKRTHVLRRSQLRLNPLSPPHPKVRPEEWAATASDVLAVSLRLPPASRNLLRVCIHDLQERNGVLSGSDRHPTLLDLRQAVHDYRGNAVIRQALLNRLDAVIAELGPEVLGHRRGFPIAELARRVILYELDGLSFFSQNLIANFRLGPLFAWRSACPEERNGAVVFVYDEAQRAFSRRAEASYSEGPAYLSTMASLVRGADITLIVNVQTTEDLARSIVANSSIKVMGRLGDHQDYERMGRCMGMKADQIEAAMKMLRPGLYVAVAGGIGFQEPFLLRVPLAEANRRVTDQEAWQSGEELRAELLRPEGTDRAKVAPLALPAPRSVIAEGERDFLKALEDEPYIPSSRLPRLLGVSNRKAQRLRESLVSKSRLKEWRVELSPRGGKTLLLEVLSEGGSASGQKAHPGRKGNFLHRLGVDLAQGALKAEGYETECEKALGADGKTTYLDLFASHPRTGETVGVEVETQAARALGNLGKGLKAGLDRVVIVAVSRKLRRDIRSSARKQLKEQDLARVSFATLSDYWETTSARFPAGNGCARKAGKTGKRGTEAEA